VTSKGNQSVGPKTAGSTREKDSELEERSQYVVEKTGAMVQESGSRGREAYTASVPSLIFVAERPEAEMHMFGKHRNSRNEAGMLLKTNNKGKMSVEQSTGLIVGFSQ
jgi:hypothetical protein